MKKDMGRQQARDRDGKTSDRGKEEICSGVQGGGGCLKTLGALRSQRFSEFMQVLVLAVCFASRSSRNNKSVQIDLKNEHRHIYFSHLGILLHKCH